MSVKMYVAPLQGYTESAWRRFHAEVYGNIAEAYFSPFVRMEKGEPRRRDLREIVPENNEGLHLVPQIIFRDADEFVRLSDAVASLGYREIDLNMGCPFPLQTGKGRGATLLRRPELLAEISKIMESRTDMSYSVKMRLGLDSPDEWRDVMDVFNAMPLRHITVHPRIASQGYDGELCLDPLDGILSLSAHPVVFNGNLCSRDDCDRVLARFPGLSGLMIGRGLLARPSLLAEIESGAEWDSVKRMRHIGEFHERMFDYAVGHYCGDSQILSKIKPFWEYLEPEIGRRAAKAIRKAGSIARYEAAVASALRGG